MIAQQEVLDVKVLQRLVRDIGLDNTLKFMDSLDNEFQKRIDNIQAALAEKSFAGLTAEAHALKSSAQISGAFRLAEILVDIEVLAKEKNSEVFSLAREAIDSADLTRFAFLDVKFDQ